MYGSHTFCYRTLLTRDQLFALHPKQGYQIQILNKIIASLWEGGATVAQGVAFPFHSPSHMHLVLGQAQTQSEENALVKNK